MSPTTLIIVIVLLLTLLGTVALVLFTVKYYWGERGAPPLTGEARRKQLEEELQLREKQLEYSESNPRQPRSQDFLDNRKQDS